MEATETQLIEAVERSPEAAGRHDRSGWLDLFTEDGRVEDPVGSRPHVGAAQLGRFYDTFIAPRQIVFHRDVDHVLGDTVLRDLTLHIQMSDAVTMSVPAFLRYVLRDVDGELKIAELQAFWELPAMMWQFARNGLAAAPAGLTLARSLVANQGLGGSAGFLRGMRRPSRQQREALVAALTAMAVGDELATRRSLASCELTVDRDVLAQRVHGASWGKVIAAGNSVAAAVYTRDGRLVVIADFGDRAAIDRLRVFG